MTECGHRSSAGTSTNGFGGNLIANAGFDRQSAIDLIQSGLADLVSFGKPFIGNPDLVRRLREDLPLSPSAPETYYQGDAHGYVDYPAAS